MKEKIPLSHKVVCFPQMLDFETSNSKSEVSKSNWWKVTSFLENYITSEGAVSHNCLLYQPLPIIRNQERCPLPWEGTTCIHLAITQKVKDQ